MKKIGVIGTMVWDTIHGRNDIAVEEWGGIAYALGALEAGLGKDWEIVPLVKVGRDLAMEANEFLRELTRRSAATRFLEVPEPNNRVTLRYTSDTRRTEQLRGGVPGWSWEELGPLVRDLDAIYLNFISGWELDLETNLGKWSAEIYRIYGHDPQEGLSPLMSQELEKYVPHEDRGLIASNIRNAIKDDTPFSIFHRVVRASGEIRYVEARGEVFRDDDGRALRVFGTLFDITERNLADVY